MLRNNRHSSSIQPPSSVLFKKSSWQNENLSLRSVRLPRSMWARNRRLKRPSFLNRLQKIKDAVDNPLGTLPHFLDHKDVKTIALNLSSRVSKGLIFIRRYPSQYMYIKCHLAGDLKWAQEGFLEEIKDDEKYACAFGKCDWGSKRKGWTRECYCL